MRAYSTLAAAVPFTILLAGCHPPDREIYEESRTCIGVLDASLSVVPPARLRQAGIDPFDVNEAAEGSLDDALKFRQRIGLDSKTVLKQIDESKAKAIATYANANAPGAEPKLAALIQAVKDCLPKDNLGGNA